MKYIEYFGMKKEPFSDDLKTKELLPMPGTLAVKERLDYVMSISGVMVITGDVGTGKSTAIRWSLDQFHDSEINSFYVVANSGSAMELYKQMCWSLGLEIRSSNRSLLIKEFKAAVTDILAQKKNKTVIIIDEASLLRGDIFAELHIINQFNFDSEKRFALVLVGQNNLLDKLKSRAAAPLASRVTARAHIPSVSENEMDIYLKHHLKVSGIKANLFSDNATTAIWQGSGGLLRKSNQLARGALVACMADTTDRVNEEHVRRASTELI